MLRLHALFLISHFIPIVYTDASKEVESLFALLQSDHNVSAVQLSHFVVVGNGPLTTSERHKINSFGHTGVVLRFNDENNYVSGDAVHVHAIRHPSWSSRKNGLVEWHIAPYREWIPKHSMVSSIVYEPQYEGDCDGDAEERLFPSTCNDATCWTNKTKYGASTGGVVLSKLNEHVGVANVSVFGMNWNGNSDHIDFRYPDLVQKSCTKCTIHKTHSDDYGQGGTIVALTALASVAVLGFLLSGWIFELEGVAAYRYMFVRSSVQQATPAPTPVPVPAPTPAPLPKKEEAAQLPLLPLAPPS